MTEIKLKRNNKYKFKDSKSPPKGVADLFKKQVPLKACSRAHTYPGVGPSVIVYHLYTVACPKGSSDKLPQMQPHPQQPQGHHG